MVKEYQFIILMIVIYYLLNRNIVIRNILINSNK